MIKKSKKKESFYVTVFMARLVDNYVVVNDFKTKTRRVIEQIGCSKTLKFIYYLLY